MSIMDELRASLSQGSGKLSELAGKWLGKGDGPRGDAGEKVRETLQTVGEKAHDITRMACLKFELANFPKLLDQEYRKLGEIALELISREAFQTKDPAFAEQLERVDALNREMRQAEAEFDALRQCYSDNYVVDKLSEDLAAADAVIEKVVISEASNVVNRLLKELLLPKEALVSAIKREGDIIIPDGNTRLKAGDQVIVIGKKDGVAKIVKRFSAS